MLLSVGVIFTMCGFSHAATLPAGWQTYRNSEYGFTISYPKDFTFYSLNPDYQEAQLSYIPICERSSVACFEYSGSEYGGTNFGAAGVAVNILREKRTKQQCGEIDTGSYPIKRRTLNGIQFRFGETGGAATSHWIGGPAYRTFRENVCFEVALLITGTSTGAYDEGAVREFSPTKLNRQLDRIFQTFRFAGHVVDGPAWKPYYESGCAGAFEHPDTASVVRAIEYRKEKSESDELSCEEYFTVQGSNYTVSSKNGFPGPLSLANWLENHGYPSLKSAHEESSTQYTKTYKAGAYYYVYGQTTLFILSVTDAKHKGIDSESDPIFRHFLHSFQAN